jgi:hypothetical protein
MADDNAISLEGATEVTPPGVPQPVQQPAPAPAQVSGNVQSPDEPVDLSGATEVKVPGTTGTPPTGSRGFGDFMEDIAYPAIGASAGAGAVVGALAGAPTGPGDAITTLAGGALGGMAGEEMKRGIRYVTGRDDENTHGLAHLADDATSGLGGAAQTYTKAVAAAKAAYPYAAKFLGDNAISRMFALDGTTGKVVPSIAADAPDIGAKVLPSVKTASGVLDGIENYVRTSLGGGAAMSKGMDKAVNDSVAQVGNSIADHFSTIKDPAEAGYFVQHALSAAQDAATETYGQALDKIDKAGGGDVTIPFKGGLQSSAQKLADQMLPASKDVDMNAIYGSDGNRVLSFLKQFTTANNVVKTEASTSPIVDEYGRSIVTPGTTTSTPKAMTWDDGRKIVVSLNKMIGSNDQGLTANEGAMIQFRNAVKEEMAGSLKAAGKGDLARVLTDANEEYGAAEENFQSSFIKRLIKEGNPETIANALTAGGGLQTNAARLTSTIGDKNMGPVRGYVLRNLMTASTPNGSEVVDGSKFASKWNALGPKAQEALYPDEGVRGNIQKLANVWAAAPKSVPQTSQVSRSMTQSLMGTGATAAGGLAFGHGGLIVGAGLSAASMIGPNVAARIMSTPTGSKLMADMATNSLGRRAAAQASVKLLQMAHSIDDEMHPDVELGSSEGHKGPLTPEQEAWEKAHPPVPLTQADYAPGATPPPGVN